MGPSSSFEFRLGDCMKLGLELDDESIDTIITSPPYWKQREYDVEDTNVEFLLGMEKKPEEYVSNMVNIFSILKTKLKKTGSLWLNLGDKYVNKNLMGMPWRVALAMMDDGWILRNDVIWHRMKGTQSAKDKLRDNHEYIFHFVKKKKYFYDLDAIRIERHKKPTMKNGRIISSTGVSGQSYYKKIKNSNVLTDKQKENATEALNQMLGRMKEGTIDDFRMYIKGEHRVLHSDKKTVSGRAREMDKNGYYFMSSTSKGKVPSDIWSVSDHSDFENKFIAAFALLEDEELIPGTLWNITPEDEWRKDAHYAVFPTELLQLPIKATCPEEGIILDPFMGTGSTIVAAVELKRKGIGFDVSQKYIDIANSRMEKVISAENP